MMVNLGDDQQQMQPLEINADANAKNIARKTTAKNYGIIVIFLLCRLQLGRR